MPCSDCTTDIYELAQEDDSNQYGVPKTTCTRCGTTYDLRGRAEHDKVPLPSSMNKNDGNGVPLRIKEQGPATQPQVTSDEERRDARKSREQLTELMKQMRKDQGGIEAVRKGVYGPAYEELVNALDGLAEIEEGRGGGR